MSNTNGRNGARAQRLGRPPAGADGEKISEYAQICLRLPPPTKALLEAITGMTGMPVWRVLDKALAAYVRELPHDEQQVLSSVRQQRARRE